MSWRGLVVFDIGGVLVRAGRTWVDDAERAGFAVSAAWRAEFEPRLLALPDRSIGGVESERYLALFAEASNGAYSRDDARRITDASLIAEYPGVDRLFDALDVARIPTAVLSNVNDAEWDRLFPAVGVDPEFPALRRVQHRFASHLIHVAKPDPRAFNEVEQGTGCSGVEILFFDDRLENVNAARAFGWTAELIDHTGDTVEQVLALLRVHSPAR